jgi:predicted Zn-dependent peptidase
MGGDDDGGGAMTINEILEQAKKLSPAEREELARRLLELPAESPETERKPKTGAEIVAMIEALPGPIEFVDDHIEDPVEWVKTQRQKRLGDWGEEE